MFDGPNLVVHYLETLESGKCLFLYITIFVDWSHKRNLYHSMFSWFCAFILHSALADGDLSIKRFRHVTAVVYSQLRLINLFRFTYLIFILFHYLCESDDNGTKCYVRFDLDRHNHTQIIERVSAKKSVFPFKLRNSHQVFVGKNPPPNLRTVD